MFDQFFYCYQSQLFFFADRKKENIISEIFRTLEHSKEVYWTERNKAWHQQSRSILTVTSQFGSVQRVRKLLMRYPLKARKQVWVLEEIPFYTKVYCNNFLITKGCIPEWINGSFYQNGPGLLDVTGERVKHLFDAFSLIQKWVFDKIYFIVFNNYIYPFQW